MRLSLNFSGSFRWERDELLSGFLKVDPDRDRPSLCCIMLPERVSLRPLFNPVSRKWCTSFFDFRVAWHKPKKPPNIRDPDAITATSNVCGKEMMLLASSLVLWSVNSEKLKLFSYIVHKICLFSVYQTGNTVQSLCSTSNNLLHQIHPDNQYLHLKLKVVQKILILITNLSI